MARAVTVIEEAYADFRRVFGRGPENPWFEEYMTDDADMVVAAYGIAARIVKASIKSAREKGFKVGLIRPITLFPFPDAPFERACGSTAKFLVIEMNLGQMVEDVRLAVEGRRKVEFYGRPGGGVPTPGELLKVIKKAYPKG